jgi:hypothetical protein
MWYSYARRSKNLPDYTFLFPILFSALELDNRVTLLFTFSPPIAPAPAPWASALIAAVTKLCMT